MSTITVANTVDPDDEYRSQLSKIIQLFQDYNPGKITQQNITNICNILNLETFVDTLTEEHQEDETEMLKQQQQQQQPTQERETTAVIPTKNVIRLSIASKIIVIDIDFVINSENTSRFTNSVKDAKLVLASNFDNFNYFNPSNKETNKTSNIIYNSLKLYDNLVKFYQNLKFLTLLDKYSSTGIDDLNTNTTTTTTGNINGTTNTSSETNNAINFTSNSINNTGNTFTHTDGFDLFKYFTMLESYLRHCFEKFPNLEVVSNYNDLFGIYFMRKSQTPLLKLTFEEVNDSSSSDNIKPLLEFEHKHGEWYCPYPNKSISGICLVLQVLDENLMFTDNLIAKELLLPSSLSISHPEQVTDNDISLSNHGDTVNTHNNNNNNNNNNKNKNNNGNKVTSLTTATSGANDKYVEITFTSKFYKYKKFNISNENLNYLTDIVKWIYWYDTVLKPFISGELPKKGNVGISGTNSMKNSAVNHKGGRRPSTNVMQEEGIQQISLHDIIRDNVKAGNDGANMGIDNDIIMEDDELDNTNIDNNRKKILISEDYVFKDGYGSISFYDHTDDVHNDLIIWKEFMDKI
ncbi:uncharacterized protein SCODWIG_02089 [Saccharomycodes ludwigii]|uniref:Uncharacterized protein n=1 Tax=Saccharomycodes ludwigii TaxID=36035 RepID=A0A376B6M5_9ASCO|nr:hypothetical protein SCDLUD_000577 [Saccharomycodes ludwigii]KAH3902977.1 hypothetical protein SCDLUD_000577 [Saccharomycodes ludwigii]SSD60328.1 uncharacterized protein SCODWIG_02089 [Saccharomycodes ludwigii]